MGLAGALASPASMTSSSEIDSGGRASAYPPFLPSRRFRMPRRTSPGMIWGRKLTGICMRDASSGVATTRSASVRARTALTA